MSEYKGKIIWITGASSGIGEALAKTLAKEGAIIVLSARRESELQRVAKLLDASAQSMILTLDLADTINVAALAKQVADKFGRIDVLINNGGISQRSLAKDTPLDIDRKIMEVNYFGQIALTKAVLPYMLKQKSGHIVVMSSISGKFGFYLRTAYSASKHALHGFFEALRLENEESGIKVTMAVPGKIQSNISLNALKDDGTPHDKMDQSQAEGMPALECARIIVNAMKDSKEEILVGNREIKAVWIKRHFPGMFGRIIRKQKRE
jgi:dehydrogenase/reductase SDR family protein 7B